MNTFLNVILTPFKFIAVIAYHAALVAAFPFMVLVGPILDGNKKKKEEQERQEYWAQWRQCKTEYDAFDTEEKRKYRHSLMTYAKTKMTVIDQRHK